MTTLFDLDYLKMKDHEFIKDINNLSNKGREDLYLKAKNLYYKGNPIMSDRQFDTLEELLKKENSAVINLVGGTDVEDDRKLKHKHMSPMLSLDKIQVNDEDKFPLQDLVDWCSGMYPLEATPKFDGNAVELEYIDGKLKIGISRGRDGKGADLTPKLMHLVPNVIPSKKRLEIRGEVVMPLKTFLSKYKDKIPVKSPYKNPRSAVAGILGNDAVIPDMVKDCAFVAYSIKMHTDQEYFYVDKSMENLQKLGFNSTFPIFTMSINNQSDFRRVYDEFKAYRGNKSPVQLDGIVLKMSENVRSKIGENSHHPKWAIALKFPSKEAQTKILSVEYSMGGTGELSFVGILEPVDLDGSTVQRVSLYNKTKMETMGMFPGAIVNIKKSGDIIPMITKIVKESPLKNQFIKNQDYYPSHCPSCGTKLIIETANSSKDDDATEHILCKNVDCPAQAIRKLNQGIKALNIKGIGESIAEDLYSAGVKNIMDLFDPRKMNKASLISSGKFVNGRALEIILACPEKLRDVELWRVILSLQFTGLGETGSKEVAKKFAKVDYSFEGLERAVVEPFHRHDSQELAKLLELTRMLMNKGINVTYPVKAKTGSIGFEMTGSPSDSGYKTKEEFVQFMESKGYFHTKLKEAKILITDSHSSTSSKMGDAKKKGITIKTYEEIINELK